MKKTISFLLACVSLAGCATFGQQIEAGLNSLIGKPERAAFDALGYPSGQQEFGGDKVYVWGRSRNSVAFYGTGTTSQAVPVSHSCTVKVITGANGIIKSWDYDGSRNGCRPYIQRLKAYQKRNGV